MLLTKRNITEKGLTLIECLVGMMVIAIIISAITPPLLIAFATRVQNYKASQAMKIAQGEIERVRLLVEKGKYQAGWTRGLPPQMPLNDFDYLGVGAPITTTPNGPCPLTNVQGDANPRTTWCSVDINGDGQWDLGVQTFRTPPFTTRGNPRTDEYPYGMPIAFVMTVRVYTRAALESGNLNKPPGNFPRDKTVSLGMTAGESLTLPLVNRSEIIVRSDLNISRELYCELDNKINNLLTSCY
ncbi:MAG: type II secretion system GspH family protein [Oscillatoriaceae bacterium SKW80]|nr:type II secretion system GspH family protein [Oscillatoriaceae bacterium SKYG93]MCX8121200.1 type II secretion system GspH family protein [Oscillatoriaceae bacterium SKW80]MDW8453470.1 type II secretion system protein [Oscillatoriaceae cyanobacterium SKYGB_i_bin93]HIK26820.1 type II secretion system protein [Oscillatoriaceae cyanobacterium M7585_C2015_266]